MSKEKKGVSVVAVSIIADKSNNNSDFDGARMLNGKLVSSDKSLKFYHRRVLEKQKDAKVLYSKTYKDGKDGNRVPKELKDRIVDLGLTKPLDFLKLNDVRFYGVTAIHNSKKLPQLAYTGPFQWSYGTNISDDNEDNILTITSQFSSGKESTDSEGNKKDNAQSTIGSENRVGQANFIHYGKLFPNMVNNIPSFTEEDRDKIEKFTEDEWEQFIYTLYNCVGSSVEGSVHSNAKSNTKVGLVIVIDVKEGSRKDISITNLIQQGESLHDFDLSKVYNKLNKYQDDIERVRIIYDEDFVSITDVPNLEMYKTSPNGY